MGAGFRADGLEAEQQREQCKDLDADRVSSTFFDEPSNTIFFIPIFTNSLSKDRFEIENFVSMIFSLSL